MVGIEKLIGETMSEAPFYDICVRVTDRNCACYLCFNCGNNLDCS